MRIDLEIKSALQWFKDNDVPAYEDDGSIYVQAGRDADVQISKAEIFYRADLQQQEMGLGEYNS